MTPRDLVLTEDHDGYPLVHRLECNQVAVVRELGNPVFTLLGCKRPLPADFRRCACLEEPS